MAESVNGIEAKERWRPKRRVRSPFARGEAEYSHPPLPGSAAAEELEKSCPRDPRLQAAFGQEAVRKAVAAFLAAIGNLPCEFDPKTGGRRIRGGGIDGRTMRSLIALALAVLVAMAATQEAAISYDVVSSQCSLYWMVGKMMAGAGHGFCAGQYSALWGAVMNARLAYLAMFGLSAQTALSWQKSKDPATSAGFLSPSIGVGPFGGRRNTKRKKSKRKKSKRKKSRKRRTRGRH
jgi:hypothetical protein